MFREESSPPLIARWPLIRGIPLQWRLIIECSLGRSEQALRIIPHSLARSSAQGLPEEVCAGVFSSTVQTRAGPRVPLVSEFYDGTVTMARASPATTEQATDAIQIYIWPRNARVVCAPRPDLRVTRARSNQTPRLVMSTSGRALRTQLSAR